MPAGGRGALTDASSGPRWGLGRPFHLLVKDQAWR